LGEIIHSDRFARIFLFNNPGTGEPAHSEDFGKLSSNQQQQLIATVERCDRNRKNIRLAKPSLFISVISCRAGRAKAKSLLSAIFNP